MSAAIDPNPDDPDQPGVPGGRAVVAARAPEPALITPAFARLLAMQAAFGFAFSVFILLPKVLVSAFGGTPSEIGVVMAAFAVASLLVIPAVGRTVERLGFRGTLMVANLLLAAAAFGFMGVHAAGAAAAVLRGLQGVAWSLGFAAGMAMAAELAPAARLAQAIGVFGAASLAMNAIGPALAEPLGERLGHRAVFALAGAAALLGAALARRLPALAPHEPAHPANDVAPPRIAGIARVYTLVAMVGLSFGVMFTFIAPYALGRGIGAVRAFFIAYTLSALAVRVVAARLADQVGHRRIAAGASAAYGLTVVAAGLWGPGHLALLGAAFGAAHGALFPAMMALLLAGTYGRGRARALGLANGAINLGLAAVFLVGLAAQRLGYPLVFVLSGALTVVSAALNARGEE